MKIPLLDHKMLITFLAMLWLVIVHTVNLRLVCESGLIAVRMGGGYFRDNERLANYHNPCQTYSMKKTLISEITFFRFSNIQEENT